MKYLELVVVYRRNKKVVSSENNSTVRSTSNRKNRLRFSFLGGPCSREFGSVLLKRFPRFASLSFPPFKFRGTEATFVEAREGTLCAGTRKDDPNSRFAAFVFGFIFSSSSASPWRDVSIFKVRFVRYFHGINVGLLAHPWTARHQKVFF